MNLLVVVVLVVIVAGIAAAFSILAKQNRARENFRHTTVERPPQNDGDAVGTLVCISGPLDGASFSIVPSGLVIGRDGKRATLVVDVAAIDERHLWIGPRDGRVFAIDEGSRGGTWLNQLDAPRIEKVALQPGDTLILGDGSVRFRFTR